MRTLSYLIITLLTTAISATEPNNPNGGDMGNSETPKERARKILPKYGADRAFTNVGHVNFLLQSCLAECKREHLDRQIAAKMQEEGKNVKKPGFTLNGVPDQAGIDALRSHPDYQDTLYRLIRGCINRQQAHMRTAKQGVLHTGRPPGSGFAEVDIDKLPNPPKKFADQSLAGANPSQLERMNERSLNDICTSFQEGSDPDQRWVAINRASRIYLGLVRRIERNYRNSIRPIIEGDPAAADPLSPQNAQQGPTSQSTFKFSDLGPALWKEVQDRLKHPFGKMAPVGGPTGAWRMRFRGH